MSIPLPRLLSQSFRDFDFTDCLINRGIIYWRSQSTIWECSLGCYDCNQPYDMNVTSSLGKICIFSSRYRSGVIINLYITTRWQSECNIFVFVQISVWDTFVFIQISVWDILYHQYFYLCLLFCLSSMSFNAQNICCRLTISLDVVSLCLCFVLYFMFYA